MKRSVLLLVSLAACGAEQPAEHYGFVTTLGSDTISVESVSRQGNELISDEADRFPRVHQRHTTIALSDDGSIERLVMDIHTPSEPENQRDRHVEAQVSGNTVKISKHDGTGTVKRSFDTGGALAMAHVPQMYSLYDLYFAAALKRADALHLQVGDTVRLRQFYIDREFDNFPLHRGYVRLAGPAKAEIRHDWLSGIGEATLDSAHNLLSYSGARTTYDVRVKRVVDPLDVHAIGERLAALEAKSGVKQLSVRDTLRAKIGNAAFMVDYGRPLARGRTLLGDVVRYGSVWRTGANAATQLSTSVPIKLGGLDIPAGMYTLWTVPRENGTDLIVNKQTGQWGTEYNPALNLGRAPMKVETAPANMEKFTISIVPADTRHGTLVLEWGTFRWTAPIVVGESSG